MRSLKAFVVFLALAIMNYSVSPSVFAMGQEAKPTSEQGGDRGTAAEAWDYAQREASSGELAEYVGGQDATTTMDPLLLTLGIVLFVLLFVALLANMDSDGGGGGDYTPPPPESYTQEPVRGLNLKVLVSWSATFTPADSNGYGVWANEQAPAMLVAALNDEGRQDGNSFTLSNDGSCNVNLRVYEYSDGNQTTPHNSLRAEMYALGHRDMVCSVSTGSTGYRDEMVDDLATRIYSWLHNGWHK